DPHRRSAGLEYATGRAILDARAVRRIAHARLQALARRRRPGTTWRMRVRALLSVATRDGITVFARGLQALGVDVFATDGTREHLAQDGVEVRPVADITGVRSMLDGQVKTFHHAVYAGILARRDQPEQLEELKREAIEPIDLVVVNVRPFGAEIGRALIGIDKAIDMIDVGGAALLGAAARNPAA